MYWAAPTENRKLASFNNKMDGLPALKAGVPTVKVKVSAKSVPPQAPCPISKLAGVFSLCLFVSPPSLCVSTPTTPHPKDCTFTSLQRKIPPPDLTLLDPGSQELTMQSGGDTAETIRMCRI